MVAAALDGGTHIENSSMLPTNTVLLPTARNTFFVVDVGQTKAMERNQVVAKPHEHIHISSIAPRDKTNNTHSINHDVISIRLLVGI